MANKKKEVLPVVEVAEVDNVSVNLTVDLNDPRTRADR